MYAILKKRGIDVGVTKKPMRSLSEKESKAIITELQKKGYL